MWGHIGSVATAVITVILQWHAASISAQLYFTFEIIQVYKLSTGCHVRKETNLAVILINKSFVSKGKHFSVFLQLPCPRAAIIIIIFSSRTIG